MAQTINVGVIGAGRIGRVHAENLAYRIPGVKLVAIADVIVDAAKKLAADLGVPTALRDRPGDHARQAD